MATLREILLTEDKTPVVLADVQALLDHEVKRKRGVSGIAVKTGYKVVKTFRRGFLTKVIADLVPEFCEALEPLHEEHVAGKNGTFGGLMKKRETDVTNALLGITDGKAERSSNRVIKKTYRRLRPAAERNVRDAIPGLAELMDKHYDADADADA